MATALPANVNLIQLLAASPGTTIVGTEPLESVQTNTSVAFTVNQVLSFVQSNFSIGNLATMPGLSVLGVTGNATATAAAIIGTTDQVLRVAQNGTALTFGAINLATTAAVTGVLPLTDGGFGTTTLTANGVVYGAGTATPGITAAGATNSVLWSGGGVPSFTTTPIIGGFIASTNVNSTATFVRLFNGVNDATIQQQGGGATLWWQVAQSSSNGNSLFWSQGATPNIASAVLVFTNTNLVQVNSGQPLVSGGARTAGLSISNVTGLGLFAGTGAPTLSAGTSSLYLRNDATGTTTRLYINLNGSTSWTAIAALA